LRTDKGYTVDAAAREAKKRSPERPWSAAKITRIENRQLQRLREADLLTLLDVYGVDDEKERAAYVKLAKEVGQTGWWIGYRDILGTGTYIDLETEANELRSYEALCVPGLLQTPDYTEALVRGSGVIDEHQITRRVEAHMMRRQVLERSDAPLFTALVDEAAIHKIPRETAPGQIRHLIAVQRPTVQVRIVPNSIGPHPAMGGSFVVMSFPHDLPVVYLEQPLDGLFLEEEQEVQHYERLFTALEKTVLSVEDSVAFLEEFLIENTMHVFPESARWRTSSYTQQQNCVEVADTPESPLSVTPRTVTREACSSPLPSGVPSSMLSSRTHSDQTNGSPRRRWSPRASVYSFHSHAIPICGHEEGLMSWQDGGTPAQSPPQPCRR